MSLVWSLELGKTKEIEAICYNHFNVLRDGSGVYCPSGYEGLTCTRPGKLGKPL